MLVAIITIFVLCWAPITINNLLVSFQIFPPLHIGHFKYMREAFHIMSYANSCVNPVVYGFMSKNFRQIFIKSLCGCVRGKAYIRRQKFKSQTEVSNLHEEAYSTRWPCAENQVMMSGQSPVEDVDILDVTAAKVNAANAESVTGI